MASRPYIPSVAVLRALSRPSAPRCSLLPRLPIQFARGKRKSAKPELSAEDREAQQAEKLKHKLLVKAQENIRAQQAKLSERPTDSMASMGLPEISWWEQDLDKPGKPMTLISKIATRADMEKHQKTAAMMDERDRNPDYDDAELNKRLMDDLIANPNFADLTESLQALKSTIKTKEEKEEMEQRAKEALEPTERELNAMSRMAIDGALQELLEDPDLVDYKQDIRDVRDKLPEEGDLDTPEFVEAMEGLEKKLEGSEAYQAKLERWRKEQEVDVEGDGSTAMEEMRKIEAMLDADEREMEIDDPMSEDPDVPENMEELLVQMRELLGALNDSKSKEITSEIDALMAEDPIDESAEEDDKELDLDFLISQIQKIRENPAHANSPSLSEPSSTEVIDPELEAKVDKIMQDPELLEKLAYLTKIIKVQKTNLVDPDIESPPDPTTLSDVETTTLAAQLRIAENDPEHLAAMRRLRINLMPPFSVSPALKSLNQALKIAYCCSNDGVRRILWRSYMKARTLPTFLQSMTDDAWDMIYYSQAVKWAGNENRENHLRIILGDMKSVGRDGPPTHPSTLKRGSRKTV
jgi:hypothetical protein